MKIGIKQLSIGKTLKTDDGAKFDKEINLNS